MSKGKEMFMKYKTRIGELYQKMRNGEITEEEKKELYDLRERLFGTIKRYGFSLARNKVIGDAAYVDTMAEIESELFIVFCNVLERYDGIHAVTTFFRPHFQGAITSYFSKRNGISQYQKQQIEIVNRSRQKCDENNILPSVKNLAEMSGISKTKVNNVLRIEKCTQHVYLDEIYSLKDKKMTSEELVLENEAKNLLRICAYKDLLPREYEFFCKLLNIASFKVTPTQRIPYKKIADEIGYSTNEVKELFKAMKEKLAGDSTLRNYFCPQDTQKNNEE